MVISKLPVSSQAYETHDSRKRSYINDLCAHIERDVTVLSAHVTHWAVENLSALQGIVWNLK